MQGTKSLDSEMQQKTVDAHQHGVARRATSGASA
jgi:hypothetical protein